MFFFFSPFFPLLSQLQQWNLQQLPTPKQKVSGGPSPLIPAELASLAADGLAAGKVVSDQCLSLSPWPDDDAWDLITCFCLKPFAGRPMIECNECATWIHLSCAKIRKSNVPEVFICQRCRDAKQEIRRSNRARTVPRKRFCD